MRIGIDFGTTHTSAALYDGQTINLIPLDPENPNPHLLRSMIYITREQRCSLGLTAVRNFLEQDTGRAVVYAEKMIGTIEYTVAQQDKGPLDPDGPITVIQDVMIDEDIGAKGRLLQSIKTGLRGDLYQGTQIFDRYYTLPELIALILGHVRSQAESYLQREVRQATLGRPVLFSTDPAEDHRAEERLRAAATLAGFTEIDFLPEPVAAAAFYLHQVQKSETVLIFDFGGGTLDLTLLRTDGAGGHIVLATHGVLVGGDDLDSALMHHRVAHSFGANTPIDQNFDGRPVLFPEKLAIHLDQWQTIPLLSRPEPLAVIRRAQRHSPEGHKFYALEALVTQNHGFALFEQIEQAKRRLSSVEQTRLELHVDQIDLALEITRRDFHLAVADALSAAREGVREILTMAGITAGEVEVVVLTGGSSVIPVFQKMLLYECPSARLLETDAFSSVTSGLAIHAYRPSGQA